MFIIFILIQIKFHIDINNDELLETITTENNRERKKKKRLQSGQTFNNWAHTSFFPAILVIN
jgi:hypothetical protein